MGRMPQKSRPFEIGLAREEADFSRSYFARIKSTFEEMQKKTEELLSLQRLTTTRLKRLEEHLDALDEELLRATRP